MVIAEQYSSLIDDKTTLQRKNSTSVDEEEEHWDVSCG
jgi:hypothetical protein